MMMSFADNHSLAACARSSKFVSEHALDALYHQGPSFFDVLNLLCPLIRNEDDCVMVQYHLHIQFTLH